MVLADISGFIDVSLMNTIAQCSATFIAITAGFFTTKMISLSTERSRIQRKKSEIESQLLTLKQKETRFNDKGGRHLDEVCHRKSRPTNSRYDARPTRLQSFDTT